MASRAPIHKWTHELADSPAPRSGVERARLGFDEIYETWYDEVSRWGSSDVSLIGLSRSAERLRARGHGSDVDFVLHHVNDRSVVCVFETGDVNDPVAKRRRLEEETPTPAWGTPGPPASR